MNNRKTTPPETDVTVNPKLDRVWSEQSDELPPMAIDSAILTKAREEVAASRRRIGFLPASWVLPIGGALAAGLVLGVSLGTFKQSGAPDEAAIVMSPTSVSEGARMRSLAPTPTPSASRKNFTVAEAESTKEDEALEQVLVKPLERQVPRAPAAQAAMARSDTGSSVANLTSQKATDPFKDEPAGNQIAKADSETTVFVSTRRDESASGTSLSVTAAQILPTKAPGNSKEAISDTLSEMLDEISDAQGNLDDRELDLFFTSEESWLISIQRMLTNQNEMRALQLAEKFKQRYPDAEVPQALQALFDRVPDQ